MFTNASGDTWWPNFLLMQLAPPGLKILTMARKKLKIAMLKEALFMVKLRFKKIKYCFANICAPVTWVKYLQHSRGFNSSL